jgi:dienelactone hydrolase
MAFRKIPGMPGFDLAAPVVLRPPAGVAIDVHADLGYLVAGDRELAMDVYRPAGRGAVPVVVLVHGEADPAVLRGVRGWGQYAGWGRLLAARGLAAVAFEHRAIQQAGVAAVDAEVDAAVAAVTDRADELGVDPGRLGVAGFSAGAMLAARAVARAPGRVRCAALCYGPPDVDPDPALPPVLLVRAGRDQPGLNRAIETFLAAALAANLPVELVNHPDGHHAFDIVDDTDGSRRVIRRVLAFLGEHLTGSPSR